MNVLRTAGQIDPSFGSRVQSGLALQLGNADFDSDSEDTLMQSSEQTKPASRWALITAHLPGQPSVAIGVVLYDEGKQRLHARFRESWWRDISDCSDEAMWQAIGDDLVDRSQQEAAEFWEWLRSTPSHVIRCSMYEAESGSNDFNQQLDELYREHVATGTFLASGLASTVRA